MILELYSKNKRENDSPSFFSGNLSTLGIEMIVGMLLLPWWLLAQASLNSSTETSYTKPNNANIELIDEIIKKLKMLQ